MELLILALIALLVWYWYSASVAHDQALAAARRACEHHGLQLLDETVALERLRPRRGRDGRMRLQREYRFDFTGEGERRHPGFLTLFAGRVVSLRLELPEGTLYDSH